MKVTGGCKYVITAESSEKGTILRYIHPDSILIEGVLIRIEALQRVIVSGVVTIHRRIVLVAEYNP